MSQDGQTPLSAKAASVEAADVCDADLTFRRRLA